MFRFHYHNMSIGDTMDIAGITFGGEMKSYITVESECHLYLVHLICHTMEEHQTFS